MVGLNREQAIKVWHNSNFGRTEPEIELLGLTYAKTDHEHRLITRLFELA
jgi:hypothetical protein